MPAQKRNRYSDDYGGGSTAIRTLGAFLLCAVLSFALGFFVLARFWSNKPKGEVEGSEKNVVASAGERTPAHRGEDSPTPQRSGLPAAQPTPRTVAPRIDPEEDVQKPANLDENKDVKKPSESSQDEVQDPVEDPAKDEVKHADETPKKVETSPTPPVPAEDGKSKRHKKPAANADDAQPSKSPDEDGTPPESTDDVNEVRSKRHKRSTPKPDAETPASNGLYRVQIGVYSTREKAEEQAKSAGDKGFDTTIRAVPSGDRTLYRVQHSAHRTQAGAEAEKQRLVDAGFDAYIARP